MPRLVDLSQPIHTGMPTYPVIPTTYVGTYLGHHETERPGGVSATSSIIIMSDHAGTHVDAPIHFDPHGEPVEEIPLHVLYGPATVLDMTHKREHASVTPADVEEGFARRGVRREAVRIVLFRTGAYAHYGTARYIDYYLEITREAIEWLLDRGIPVLGVDAPTIDHARDRRSHMLVRDRRYWHIENLAHLDQIPVPLFTFIGFPLLVRGASAGPLRAVALVEDGA